MDSGAVNKDAKENTTKAKARSPTKEKERAKATKARDMATCTSQAKERFDKACHTKERPTKEDT
jgi:hypothetical protein